MPVLGPAPRRSTAPASVREERLLLRVLLALGALLTGTGLMMQSPGPLLAGWLQIMQSPKMLLSDSMAIGGQAAAFFNSGVMTLLSCGLLRWLKSPINGPAIAAVLIVSGFSFFGKHPLNAAPLVLGLLSFMRLGRVDLSSAGTPALFSTALGPLVSSVALGMGLPLWAGIPLGLVLGYLTGMLLVPVSRVALGCHRGYSLYNMGFAAGLVAMVVINVLRILGLPVSTTLLLHQGGGTILAVGVGAVFLATAGLGWWLNGRTLRGYAVLLQESGQLSCDMVARHGAGLTLCNMGFSGLMALALPLAVGSPVNGPVLGAILTVYGFGAFGKHPFNCLPVMAGALAATWLGIHDLADTSALIVVLFSTTLAPVSGAYGPAAGAAAGFLHVALAHNLGYLHAGVNLYNNGFAGGFVAMLLPPVIEEARKLLPGQRHRVG